MKYWWSQLSLRERYILLIGTLLLGILLGYGWLWEPWLKAQKQLENVVASQQMTLEWMQSAAAEIRQLRNSAKTSSSKTTPISLLSLIDSNIRQSALAKTNKRIEPKGEHEVQVEFEQVSFTELMRWLGQFYNQQPVQISNISVERQPTVDGVKARLTLTVNSER
ncbi:MAG: hypothetical protein BWK79_04315 [Beggiatoa sp. IS2]|nr:MAG: hypothetical protein BWK79_04315 [Beggiatoa sp. IS2]